MRNLFRFKSLEPPPEEPTIDTSKLARNGGFLVIVKYFVFAILGALNFHLFYVHIPGIWGVLLGLVALLFECSGLYFWNTQNHSAGKHRVALQVFAILFTALSFIHASASLYQLAGVGPDMAEPLELYSKLVAFPLLFGSMVFAVCTLHYLHWSTPISEARAKALLASETARAELATENVKLQNESQIAQARLEHFKLRLSLEEKFLSSIERFAQLRQDGVEVLHRISDPQTRQELMHLMGQTSLPPITKDRRINPLSPAASNEDNHPKA